MAALKRILIGHPISSADEHHQRLSKKIALPVFASDAISSTAYATDEILVVLLLQAGIGAAAFGPLVPIAIVVCVLMAIVVTSYRQTILAYPSGGGAYIVSRENLGTTPSLVAASALLVDYILTVSVSVAGGVLAIRTATGFETRWTVPVCLLCVFIMTVMNLRGVKESGKAFAGPTYFYITMLIILIATGLYRIFVEHVGPIPDDVLSAEAREVRDGAKSLGLLMLLRAFSSGAVALSGVEAVSNGVPAFKKPEGRNAAITLMWMGGILGSCFFGVSVLASHLKPYRGEDDGNGLGLMAEYLYGGKGVMFWLTMIATFMILVLAANTAYADFPRLSSIVARDGRTGLACRHGDQRCRRRHHGTHRGDRRDLQVHRGRMDPRRAHPGHGDRVPSDRPPLREDPSSRRRRTGILAATRDTHHGGARRRSEQGCAARHPVRKVAQPRPHHGRHRRQRRRGPPTHRTAMGRVRGADRTAHRLLAVP
jgi:hypothetical protein